MRSKNKQPNKNKCRKECQLNSFRTISCLSSVPNFKKVLLIFLDGSVVVRTLELLCTGVS